MWPTDFARTLSRVTEILAVLAVIFLAGCGLKTAREDAAQESRHVTASPDSQDAVKQIASGVKEADELKLKPFVYFTAGWCSPCQAIKESMNDDRMREAFAGTYIIEFDIDEWGEFPEGYSTGTIPVYYEVDSAGKPTGRKIDGGAWGENIPENMAPPLKAFFQAG